MTTLHYPFRFKAQRTRILAGRSGPHLPRSVPTFRCLSFWPAHWRVPDLPSDQTTLFQSLHIPPELQSNTIRETASDH
jgi:hypothetical protein